MALWMFLSFLKDHQLYRLIGGIPGPVISVPLCIFFSFWPHYVASGILDQGLNEPPVLEAQSLNHWILPLYFSQAIP